MRFSLYSALMAGTRPVFPVCSCSGWSQLCGTLPSRHAGRGGHGDLDVSRQSGAVPVLPPELHPGVSHLSRPLPSYQVPWMSNVFLCVLQVFWPWTIGMHWVNLSSAHLGPARLGPNPCALPGVSLSLLYTGQTQTVIREMAMRHHCRRAKQKWAFRGGGG